MSEFKKTLSLTAPVYRLKREARKRSRREGIALHEALDRIAREQGFRRWSLLAQEAAERSPARELLKALQPGDLLLLGARPQQGKTQLALETLLLAQAGGHPGTFFTLEYTTRDVEALLKELDYPEEAPALKIEDSDQISATFVAERLREAPRGSMAVIDYLQLLDQRRDKPTLQTQVSALRKLARDRGLILICLAQIDRAYDAGAQPLPDLKDVRLPNPLDLKLFDKACFLNEGELSLAAVT